jgi:hypothetical protein
MQSIEPGWASRFYGMPVSAEVAAATRERLTDRSIADLVDAHLAINRAYFGSVDKTLSGFVILDDEGDNYTLLDVRDGGQVWWQDHETREVSLRFDSLDDVRANRPAKQPRHRRRVTTRALCARYQWLVWLLARPLARDGKPIQSIDYLVRNGIGRFRYVFSRSEDVDRAFTAELRELADDPHLAIYWLLHTTVLADHERRQRVLIAVGASDHPLLRAFILRLGQLPVGGDLPVVAEFRARRALAQTYGPFEVQPEQMPAVCLRALELAPATLSLGNALQVVGGLVTGGLDTQTVQSTLARIPETTPGTALIAAMLEKRAKLGSSSHADVLARSLATCDDPWWAQLEALWHVHELAYDGPALVTATRRILVHDRFHRRALQMAMRAAQIAGEPIDAIYNDLGIADALLGPYGKLVEQPAAWQDIVAVLPLPHLRRALAWRVLQRVDLNKPPASLALWAAGEVLGTTDPQRAALVADAFARLEPPTQAQVMEGASAAIDGADHPLVGVLLAFLDGTEPDDTDYAALFQLRRAKEAALRALAPWLPEPALFDRLLTLVERPAGGSFVELFWSKLFSPFERTSFVLPRLDADQAVRVAKAMVTTQLRHPTPQARAAAGHQLFRFKHLGAEAYLIDALTDLGVRHAASRTTELEDVVANLYAAVRNLGTDAARDALVERLFAERRAYWRMGNALAGVWDAALHDQIMSALADRRDARAAGCYAFVLREFVKQVPPLLDLAHLILDWQGDSDVTRGLLHYALIAGLVAALDAHDHELVRRTHDAASWIGDPPLEPDAYVRGRTWSNPLDDEAVQGKLARALAGAPEVAAPAKTPARKPATAKATPAAKPKTTAKAKPKATSKPKAKPAAKPKAKPAAKPKAKLAAKAKAKPAPKPKTKPAATPKTKPTPKKKKR